MKHLVTASLLPLLCSTSLSLAAPKPINYQSVYAAELRVKYSENYSSAHVRVDGRRRTVELSLQPLMPPCAEGFVCAQVMPEPIEYKLEKARITRDDCGIIRTVASIDQRPVDGVFLKVTISNNTANTCPTLIALPTLGVVVEQRYIDRFQGKEVTRFDSFEADDIALIKPAGR